MSRNRENEEKVVKYLSTQWGELNWTPWLALAERIDNQGHAGAGLYRLRLSNGEELLYVGYTRRNIRQQINDWRRISMGKRWMRMSAEMVNASRYMQQDMGLTFEYSVAEIQLPDTTNDKIYLEMLQIYLLWLYRQETGKMPRYNLALHDITSDLINTVNLPKLVVPQTRSAITYSDSSIRNGQQPPTSAIPHNLFWMGLPWSFSLPLSKPYLYAIVADPGIYKIFDESSHELLALGACDDLHATMKGLLHKSWVRENSPRVSYVRLDRAIPLYQRTTLAGDLIGSYYHQSGQILYHVSLT